MSIKAFITKEQALLDAATPGEWKADIANRIFSASGKGTQFFVADCREPTAYRDSEIDEANAKFIANVRTSHAQAIAALRIAVEALKRNKYYWFTSESRAHADGLPKDCSCVLCAIPSALAEIEKLVGEK